MKALLILIGGLAMAFAISLDTNDKYAKMEMDMATDIEADIEADIEINSNNNMTATPLEDIDLEYVHKECFPWGIHEYCYFPHTSVSWGDAETICQRWGGHLVSINSKHERDYLHKRLYRRPDYWIGFVDNSGTNTGYQWTDGSGGFTFWHGGQPDLRGQQMCGRVWAHHGTWDNLQCWHGQRVLCKQFLRI
uniref:LECC2 protein n=1 Tax=Aphrocallistes vastus TaxID=83887 RepID=Q9BIG7_APHVA|nr:LECC2 protein [Aphrocallistes vastus]